MNKKIVVTISVILIYVALFFLFIYFSKRSYGCGYGSPCIRFCSSDTNEYSDDFLLEQFRESKTAKEMRNMHNGLKVIRGTPTCGTLKYWPPNEDVNSTDAPYEFNYVSIRNAGPLWGKIEKSGHHFDLGNASNIQSKVIFSCREHKNRLVCQISGHF